MRMTYDRDREVACIEKNIWNYILFGIHINCLNCSLILELKLIKGSTEEEVQYLDGLDLRFDFLLKLLFFLMSVSLISSAP